MDIANIEKLIALYRAGRRPPLDELVRDELLKIFQQGAVQESISSFGILLPEQRYPEDSRERWTYGRFVNAGTRWQKFCANLREWKDTSGAAVFNIACDTCDRQHAYEAAVRKEWVAYLCHAGMIDYALPIVVDNHIVAVLFAGQQCPKEGNLWSADFINGITTMSNIAGHEDATMEADRRTLAIIQQMNTCKHDGAIDLLQVKRMAAIVSPDDVLVSLRDMTSAASELSRLAESTIRYQLNEIRAYFTSQVARLLPESDPVFWDKFSTLLTHLASFYEIDYAFFCILNRPTDDYFQPITRLPEGIAVSELAKTKKASFFPLRRNESCKPIRLIPHEAKKRILSSSAIFDSPCYVIPIELNGPLGIVVFGNLKRKGLRTFLASELQLLEEQFQEISIILENRRQLRARDLYVLDLSHEMKSPLAAVVAAAENLSANRVDSADLPARMTEIRSRLRRLQMSIDRFGMLEKLLSKPELLTPKQVSVYDVAQECRGEYEELAHEKEVEIEVSKDLSSLPMILTNREAFKHALGNLIMNAVKYGNYRTAVVVEGRTMGGNVKIDVHDIGIPIYDDDRNLMGIRGFRSNDARKRDPAGTGIGFTIVDRFLKMAGGRLEIQSIPHYGASHHVVISLFLPR
jgi:signal transduction histidine kinase